MTTDPAVIAASLGRHERSELLLIERTSPRDYDHWSLWAALLNDRELVDRESQVRLGRKEPIGVITITPLGRAVAAAIRERGA